MRGSQDCFAFHSWTTHFPAGQHCWWWRIMDKLLATLSSFFPHHRPQEMLHDVAICSLLAAGCSSVVNRPYLAFPQPYIFYERSVCSHRVTEIDEGGWSDACAWVFKSFVRVCWSMRMDGRLKYICRILMMNCIFRWVKKTCAEWDPHLKLKQSTIVHSMYERKNIWWTWPFNSLRPKQRNNFKAPALLITRRRLHYTYFGYISLKYLLLFKVK